MKQEVKSFASWVLPRLCGSAIWSPSKECGLAWSFQLYLGRMQRAWPLGSGHLQLSHALATWPWTAYSMLVSLGIQRERQDLLNEILCVQHPEQCSPIPHSRAQPQEPSSSFLHLSRTHHLHLCPPLCFSGEEMATHSRVLAWKIPGTEEPGGLPSMGSHRVRHAWSALAAAAAVFLNLENSSITQEFSEGIWLENGCIKT